MCIDILPHITVFPLRRNIYRGETGKSLRRSTECMDNENRMTSCKRRYKCYLFLCLRFVWSFWISSSHHHHWINTINRPWMESNVQPSRRLLCHCRSRWVLLVHESLVEQNIRCSCSIGAHCTPSGLLYMGVIVGQPLISLIIWTVVWRASVKNVVSYNIKWNKQSVLKTGSVAFTTFLWLRTIVSRASNMRKYSCQTVTSCILQKAQIHSHSMIQSFL